MKIGEVRHGFTVNRVQAVEEIGAILIEMHHAKTGARLIA